MEKIMSEALGLPSQSRAFLAEKLIESLDVDSVEELAPEWREEVRKRCQEIEDGLVVLSEAEDVFARAYSAIK